MYSLNIYEKLLDEAYRLNICILEGLNFKSESKGLIKDDIIGLSAELETSIEKACIIAEELGHFHTTAGNILDSSKVGNRKQERVARIWSFNRMITLDKLISAWEYGCRNRYEIAEYLEVTEEFLQEAIDTYRTKFGLNTTKGNYLISFEPNLSIQRLLFNYKKQKPLR